MRSPTDPSAKCVADYLLVKRGIQLLSAAACLPFILLLSSAGSLLAEVEFTVMVPGHVLTTNSSILSINTTPVAPQVTFNIAGLCRSCQTSIFYTIYYNSMTQAGYTVVLGGTLITGDGGSTVTLNGGNNGTVWGGTVTVRWEAKNGATLVAKDGFTFKILGQQPSAPLIDSYLMEELGGNPWWASMSINRESGYQQFKLHDTDVSGNKVGNPLPTAPTGQPNQIIGEGLTQVGSTGNPALTNQDFWDWSVNLTDGVSNMRNDLSLGVTQWNLQVSNMTTDTGSKPVYPLPLTVSSCSFAYPQGSYPHPYSDTEGITRYNGGWFITWVRKSGSTPGYWTIPSLTTSTPTQAQWNSAATMDYLGKICIAGGR